MPRPRVLPSQRRRAAEACNFCRDAKKKCSGTAPCSHCLRRGIGSQCIITLRPRGPRTKNTTATVAEAGIDGSMRTGAAQRNGSESDGQNGRFNREIRPSQRTPISLLNLNGKGTRHETGGSALPPPPPSPSESRPSLGGPESPEGRRQHRASDASSVSVSGNAHSRMLLNLRGERGLLLISP